MTIKEKFFEITKILKKGAPLIPAIFAILAFLAILSPVTWSTPCFVVKVLITAAVISVVSAYCIASFTSDKN